jgi:indolepyruvate ferredoxin oxidoreductase
MALSDVSLDDRFDLSKRHVFLTGTQAIVRLTLMQRERDRINGFNTAGYVTGYRGSPVGGLDQTFWRAKAALDRYHVKFQPGLNEDLAATALWGTQQAELRGEGKYDGVFGIWYGKGPGVDRSGDVFRHANFAGSSKLGGVVALMGDDHTCESSTTAHQSEFAFLDAMIPILNPAGVQELLDYGQHGFALSRFAGTWVAMKCVKETIESTQVVDGSLDRVQIEIPQDFHMPPGGLNIRAFDGALAQEARLHDFKRDAILAYLTANRLNRIVTSGGPSAKIGIITTGKSYLDVRLAFDELGIDEKRANDLGIRLYKIACPWPLEPKGLKEFAEGLDLIIVVEEKRSLIETQVREELYGAPNQPTVIGKKDENGRWLFPVKAALDPNDIAIAIGERILKRTTKGEIQKRVDRLRQAQAALAETQDVANRTPYFCSGCPHNTSTIVPEGMRAYAGIGCHTMALYMNRATGGFTHMGGEGANWIGEAPFSKREHVFQNLGDGTYNHSGILALRAAVASGVNITYKILYNDAVAMTGGQRHEGNLHVDDIARQVAAENVKRIELVTDEPEKYPKSINWPSGLKVHHRDDLDSVQRDLAATPGVSVLIYDQTCAAEKRRRRKRGEFPDPDKRVIINELVCEGCGDCGVQSNCVAVQPLDTEWGRKREIDQSACNKDFSCLKGFCPSFVTVHGAKLKRGTGAAAVAGELPALPKPTLPAIDGTYGIIITGIGGTGIVTMAQILGTAAYLDGKAAGIIDMAGLAQKGGGVFSHLRIAEQPDDIHAIRIPAYGAELVIGGDIVVVGSKKVLSAMRPGETTVVVNTHETLPGDFTHNADFSLPTERLKREIAKATDKNRAHFVEATKLATVLFGSSFGQNIFLVGYAYQLGCLPISMEAISRAIELNGEAVDMNKSAFEWGRRAAFDLASVTKLVTPLSVPTDARHLSQSLDEKIERRAAFLEAYQSARYARRYRDLIVRMRAAEASLGTPETSLTEAAAKSLFKLMSYKDEYEVARLFTDGSFDKQVAASLEGDLKFEFHLAPPLLARKDPATGRPKKMSFGPWIKPVFSLLAKLKFLRGGLFDPFAHSLERKMERMLISEYIAILEEVEAGVKSENRALAIALLSVPMKIRGFGPVKMRSVTAARAEGAALLSRFRHSTKQNPPSSLAAAAE